MKKSIKKEVVFAETPAELRRRKAKRMPIGSSKSAILLFIASKGEADSVDLKRHLKEKFRIKNKKSLRIHLSDLIQIRLVAKRSKGKGLPDTYYLASNFLTLKGVFNYLKENGKEKDLLTTKYFKDYVASEDFQAKFFVNLVKGIILAMISYVQSDEGYKEQIKHVEKQSEIITAIRDSREIKPKYTRLEDWEKAFDLYDPKRIKETVPTMVSNINSIIESTDADTLYTFVSSFGDWTTPFMKKAPSIIIPSKELPEFLAMLRASPSATDFILNLGKDNALGLMGFLLRFIMWSVNDDPKKLKEFSTLTKDKDNFASNIPKMYMLLKDFSKVENKSPLFTLVSSMFIFDYMKRNVAINEEDQKLLADRLNEMLVPKIKSDIL